MGDVWMNDPWNIRFDVRFFDSQGKKDRWTPNGNLFGVRYVPNHGRGKHAGSFVIDKGSEIRVSRVEDRNDGMLYPISREIYRFGPNLLELIVEFDAPSNQSEQKFIRNIIYQVTKNDIFITHRHDLITSGSSGPLKVKSFFKFKTHKDTQRAIAILINSAIKDKVYLD